MTRQETVSKYIFAIDPGDVQSAYCIVDAKTYEPIEKGKLPNWGVRAELSRTLELVKMAAMGARLSGIYAGDYTVVIERIASYGMAVGATVFTTCEWIGRFAEIAESKRFPVEYIYRREEKLAICHDSKAKDANIRRALIDRFAKHDQKTGRGTKNNPDWFYGFHDDIWAAYAVAVTYLDKTKEKQHGE